MKLNVLQDDQRGQKQSRLELGDSALNLLLDIADATQEISRLRAKVKECKEALAQVVDEAREAKGGTG